jgi:hypothetical protein
VALNTFSETRTTRPDASVRVLGLYQQVIGSLREAVEAVEENELFDQMVMRGSCVGLELNPESEDIDVIMRSMMLVPDSGGGAASESGVALIGEGQVQDGEYAQQDTKDYANGLLPGKRSRNGTRKN